MSNRTRRRVNASLYRAVILSAVALVLTVLSFLGPLDDFAREQVVETTNESVGIYVISRAINALVSVLQTSQVKVPLLASAQVGEMLDPVNDVIERLSSIMVWAIGSLFVQRILLEVVASPVFKGILVSIALVTIAVLLLMEWDRFRIHCRGMLAVPDARLERFRDWVVRVFVVAAILRFVVPLFIAASFLVSQLFLGSEITQNKERLTLLRTQVTTITSAPSPDDRNLEEQKALEETRMKDLEESMTSAKRTMERLDARIGRLNDNAGWRRFLPQSFGGVSPGQELASAKERRMEVVRELERIEDDIRVSGKNIECIKERIAGGSCESLLDKISKAGTAGTSHIKDMFGRLNDMVTDITMLLIAVAIQNILFPILFLMGAVKCSLPVARHASRLLCGFERDSRKLKGMAMDRLAGPGRDVRRA